MKAWDLTKKYVKENESKKKKKKKKKDPGQSSSDSESESESDSSSGSSSEEEDKGKGKSTKKPITKEKPIMQRNDKKDKGTKGDKEKAIMDGNNNNATESAYETPWTLKKFNGPLPNLKLVDDKDIAKMLADYDFFTMAIVGKRRSGKSFLAEYLLQFMVYKYAFAIVMTDTKINGFWQKHFPENFIIEGYRPDVIETLIARQIKLKKFKLKHPEIKLNTNCLLVLEDFISNSKVRYDKGLEKMYTIGRQIDVDVIALSQDAKGLPPIMRGNTDISIIMKQYDIRQKEAMWEDYINEVDKEVYFAINSHILVANDPVNEVKPIALLIDDQHRATDESIEEKWRLISADKEAEPYVIGSRDYWAEAGELLRAEKLIRYKETSDMAIPMKIDNEFDGTGNKPLTSLVHTPWNVYDPKALAAAELTKTKAAPANPVDVDQYVRGDTNNNIANNVSAANRIVTPAEEDEGVPRRDPLLAMPKPLLPVQTRTATGPGGSQLPAYFLNARQRIRRKFV